ncbi:hypothetical protein FQA39_LY13769 [Lamprigera yunnana]|nr:hypothetical protein FQA39_LY13769 [Lamprigera yunnana]
MPFTSEQDRFIVMAHFRSGTFNPDRNWSYSLQSCIEQFMQQYPDEMIQYDIFKQHKCRLVHRFETKNCICKGKSTGRPTALTENVIENLQERINRSPKKAVSQLSQQTGLSKSLGDNPLKKFQAIVNLCCEQLGISQREFFDILSQGNFSENAGWIAFYECFNERKNALRIQ